METPSTSAPPAGPGDASKTTLERGAKGRGQKKKLGKSGQADRLG